MKLKGSEDMNKNATGNAETCFRSGQEAAEAGRSGGKRSGESRRTKKLLRETVTDMLRQPVTDEETKALIRAAGIKTKRPDNMAAIAAALIREALKGNCRAFELIRDTIGEKPTDRLQMQTEWQNIEVIIDGDIIGD